MNMLHKFEMRHATRDATFQGKKSTVYPEWGCGPEAAIDEFM